MADHPHPPLRVRSLRRQVGLLVGVVLLLGLAGRTLPLAALLDGLRSQALGWGPGPAVLLFALAYALGELLLIPGSTVSLLAGAALGPWLGSLAVWLGASSSAALAFLLARALGEQGMARFAARHPKVAAVRDRLGRRGWRWVVVLRLFPVVPYAVQNYAAGLTSLPFGPYLLASVVGMVPAVVLYAWAGFTGAEVALASAGADPLRPAEWLGLAAVGLLAMALGGLVRRRLRQAAGGAEP
jgi:uncharacterized membrane protein YdjX (TVP38/TMEM64 family)